MANVWLFINPAKRETLDPRRFGCGATPADFFMVGGGPQDGLCLLLAAATPAWGRLSGAAADVVGRWAGDPVVLACTDSPIAGAAAGWRDVGEAVIAALPALTDGRHPWRSLRTDAGGVVVWDGWNVWVDSPWSVGDGVEDEVRRALFGASLVIHNPLRNEKLSPRNFGVGEKLPDWLRVVGGPQSALPALLVAGDAVGWGGFGGAASDERARVWIGRWAGEPVRVALAGDAENACDVSDAVIQAVVTARRGRTPWSALEAEPSARVLPDRRRPVAPPRTPLCGMENFRRFLEFYTPVGLYV